jgi:hypothetical protein
MDNSYLVDAIEDAMNTATKALAKTIGTPNDQTKVNALIDIVGALQGDLLFLKSQLNETPKKKFYQFKK